MKRTIFGASMLLLLGACSQDHSIYEDNEREKAIGEKIFHELSKEEYNNVAGHIVAEGIIEEKKTIAFLIRPPEGVSYSTLKQNATDGINHVLNENDISGYTIEIKKEPKW
ncbi:membrane lipoprotein lipid attachment site-containing protein [Metabacillus indicus]|uniref:membrane lipoprotein lipid attachment site-containing protein n=1 Tax=Metabacillus indicus TaxID=246786 RepID=UPI0004931AC9|nr:membrane lipoprotein lipid attachment site-containing protein [Metabacillus indicus]KEZ48729.1 hypothetical protein AZ46_0217700 [Metabacillus indicus LMG 22858]